MMAVFSAVPKCPSIVYVNAALDECGDSTAYWILFRLQSSESE
jgi:hypothetical protein